MLNSGAVSDVPDHDRELPRGDGPSRPADRQVRRAVQLLVVPVGVLGRAGHLWAPGPFPCPFRPRHRTPLHLHPGPPRSTIQGIPSQRTPCVIRGSSRCDDGSDGVVRHCFGGSMRLIRVSAYCLCLMLLTTAVPSSAQEFRGRINGTVTDNTGAVLPGVTVTASSPALIQPQVQVTGSGGRLPVHRAASGRLPAHVRARRFPDGQARRHSRHHQPDAEPSTSSCRSRRCRRPSRSLANRPIVDTSSTQVGTNFTQRTVDRNPERARHLGGDGAGAGPADERRTTSAARAPARRPASCPTASAIRARRSSKASTRPRRTSANAGYFDFGSFEEFQVGGSGSGADSFGGGGNLSITVKSGGDRFKGTWYSDWLGDATISDNVPDAFRTAEQPRRGRVLHDDGADARQPGRPAVRHQLQRRRAALQGQGVVLLQLPPERPVQVPRSASTRWRGRS